MSVTLWSTSLLTFAVNGPVELKEELG
jgi:hypothetical protein